MSIKDIINQAKSSEYNSETQETRELEELATQLPSNKDKQEAKKSAKKKEKKKTLNLEVPAVVGNFWMGKIKTDGGTFKKLIVEQLVRKYGLPEGYKKEDL